MPKYMVERRLPGLTADQLTAAASRAKSMTAKMTAEGTPVRYLRSTFVPGEDKCFCLFEGSSADVVREAASAVRPERRYAAGGLASRLRWLRSCAPAGLIDGGIPKDLRLDALTASLPRAPIAEKSSI